MVNHELYNEWFYDHNLLTCLRNHYNDAKRAGVSAVALTEVKKELDDFEAKYNARYIPAPRERQPGIWGFIKSIFGG